MSAYQVALKELVTKTGMKQDSWSSEEWKKVAELATEQDLAEAYEKTKLAYKRLTRLGALWPRRQKTLERIQEKIAEHRGNYFKSVSDLIGFRTNCELGQIAAKINFIANLKDCICYIRQPFYKDELSDQRSTDVASGIVNPDAKVGKYVDITQYVYIYFTDIGHIVELQIGHPFAAHTFTIDSFIRDRSTRIKKAFEQGIVLDVKPGPVDLWGNNFYTNVKNYILGRANKTISDAESVHAKEELFIQMRALFGERPLSDQLIYLLDELI